MEVLRLSSLLISNNGHQSHYHSPSCSFQTPPQTHTLEKKSPRNNSQGTQPSGGDDGNCGRHLAYEQRSRPIKEMGDRGQSPIDKADKIASHSSMSQGLGHGLRKKSIDQTPFNHFYGAISRLNHVSLRDGRVMPQVHRAWQRFVWRYDSYKTKTFFSKNERRRPAESDSMKRLSRGVYPVRVIDVEAILGALDAFNPTDCSMEWRLLLDKRG